MTLLRKILVAAVAATIGVTSIIASNTSAHAWKGMGFKEMPNRAPIQRNYRHHRGFGGGLGIVGAAIAIGAAAAVAHQAHQADMFEQSRRERARINAEAKRQGWTKRVQRRSDCHRVKEWQELVDSARELLDRDKKMHAQYGEAGHSIQHVKFAEQELERRLNELKKAKAACNGHYF
jgi:hypothetical protein